MTKNKIFSNSENYRKALTIVILSLLSAAIFIGYSKVRQDDAYIFYTYAKNIAEGNGYVFNIGEKINTTTSPLYTLMLAFFYSIIKSDPVNVFPLISNFLGVICLWITAFIGLNLFSSSFKIASLIFPIAFLILPLLRNAVGMETFFTLMLMMLMLSLYQSNKYYLASLTAALAFLSRPDSILLTLVLLVDYIFRNKKIPPLKPIVLFLLIILPWIIFSNFYFGNVIPSSLSIKVMQTKAGIISSNFFDGMLTQIPGGKKAGAIFLTIVIGNIIFIYLLAKQYFKNRIVSIIVFWSLCYLFVYGFILNPPPYKWYYTPFSLLYALIFSIAIEIIIQKFFVDDQTKEKVLFATVTFLFIIGLILPFKTYKRGFDEKYKVYRDTAQWLNTNASNGDVVGIDEIGIVGFYYDKGKIVDALGLITPGVSEQLEKGNFNWYIEHYKPNFVVVDFPTPPHYHNFINEEGFNKIYRRKEIVQHGSTAATIYKRE